MGLFPATIIRIAIQIAKISILCDMIDYSIPFRKNDNIITLKLNVLYYKFFNGVEFDLAIIIISYVHAY